MTQNAIGWFDINVIDIQRATVFYQTVFNTTLEDMVDPTDSQAVMKSFPSDMTTYGAGGALVKRSGAKPGPGGTIVYFSVEDCHIQESRISAAGGTVIKPKTAIGEFGWISICMDCEGNMFGLSSMR